MSLADLDNAMEAASLPTLTAEAFWALPAPWLSNGFFTLTLGDGSHRTYRVRLEKNGIFAGKRTLALLIGPDNSTDYETQAIVAEAGFVLFKRFRSGKSAEHATTLWRLAKGEAIGGCELLVSKRCRVCNRPLTDPISIELQIGPLCRERMGIV